jgi:3-dehydroquinate synthase
MITPPTAPARIEVTTGTQTSTIWVGHGIVDELGARLAMHGAAGRRFVVSSPRIWKLHGARVQAALGQATGAAADPILIPDGERYKTLASVSRVYDALIRGGADRGSTLVAVGGGVVGDAAGFAAASFLRGIRLVQVPTTLLAQVDSSIGGKVGVNHPLGKNLIGAFHQPAVVVADPGLLRTLPKREFRSGLYEVVKYGVIWSRGLFEHLQTKRTAIVAHDPDALVPAIVESAAIKAEVVSKDEREGGLRRVLNFGHTIGHALEAVTDYRRFRHGEAIAYGMLGAADISERRGVLSSAHRTALADLIAAMGPLPAVSDLGVQAVLEAVRRDKKVVNGKLHYVLATSLGSTATVDDVSEDEIRAALVRLGLPA